MILLFTDFGSEGPYQSQMIARIRKEGYMGDVVSMFADAPAFNPQFSGILLSHYYKDFPQGSSIVAVVDPGVGGDRKAVVVKSHGRWFIGPDNGLFEYILQGDPNTAAYEIIWRPDVISNSFHGRDLFAPVAAKLMESNAVLNDLTRPIAVNDLTRPDWPKRLSQVVYIDHYGNCMTGLGSDVACKGLEVNGIVIPFCRTFSDQPAGSPLAYINANGLIEISVNQARADTYFKLSLGSKITVITD